MRRIQDKLPSGLKGRLVLLNDRYLEMIFFSYVSFSKCNLLLALSKQKTIELLRTLYFIVFSIVMIYIVFLYFME